MTTETAPAPIRQEWEILETRDDPDGMRSYRYRLTVTGGLLPEPSTHEGWANSPIEPVSRDILEDRWRGLMLQGSDPTKLQAKLDNLLWEIAERITRRDLQDEAVVDGEVVGLSKAINVDALGHVIRDWMIERSIKVAAR